MATRPTLRVRVGDLLREPGSRRSFDFRLDAPHADEADALATTAAALIGGTELAVTGEAVAMAGGVELVGAVSFDWYGECRRCLDDVTGHSDVTFREIAQREPVDDEVFPIDGDLASGYVDLAPLIRELVLATLPVAPLCRDDCPGPDPERFPTTTETELEAEADAGPPVDPRWSALGELRFDE